MRACVVTIAAILGSTGAANTLHLSDLGYVDNTVNPPICYLPHLDQPSTTSRLMPIGPEAGNAVGAEWGDIVWNNPRNPITGAGFWDGLIDTLDVAGRAVTVTLVDKTWDAARGLWIDSNPVSGGIVVFSGQALNWVAGADQITLHVRDNLIVLEQPIQETFYAGTGGAQGTSNIANQPIPKARGTVLNITPILVDPVKNTYQVSDAALTFVEVYEGGDDGFTLSADFATYALMAAAAIPSGGYATCLAHGYFRLATTPTYDITCDAVASFPSGASKTAIVDIALALLEEDCSIASGAINVTNFTAVQSFLTSLTSDTRAGLYTGTDNPTPIDLLSQLLNAISCSIGTDLNGLIDIFQLVAPNPFGTTVAEFTTAHIFDGVQSIDLPDSVVVPNWRRTISCLPNATIQTGTSLKPPPTVSNARRQMLAKPYAVEAWSSSIVRTRYPTSLDAPIIVSPIIPAGFVQIMANNMGAIWGVQRYLYDLPMPRSVIVPSSGPIVELGSIIGVTYPAGKLASHAVCEVVGMSPDMKGNTVTLRVFL